MQLITYKMEGVNQIRRKMLYVYQTRKQSGVPTRLGLAVAKSSPRLGANKNCVLRHNG
jgi:hypothetical protein